jgi:hypothetical protein
MGQSETRNPVEMALGRSIENEVFGSPAEQPPDIGNKLFCTSLEDVQINTRYLIAALTAEKNGNA